MWCAQLSFIRFLTTLWHICKIYMNFASKTQAIVCCVRTIPSNSSKYLSNMKHNMGNLSIGAWPSPAQPSSGGQGFRRSWVQGSGDQGVGQGIKGSQRVRLYKGVRGSWVQGSGGHRGYKGIRGSGGGSGCQKIRGQGVYKGFIGSGVHGFRGQEVMGSGGQGVEGSCIIHTHTCDTRAVSILPGMHWVTNASLHSCIWWQCAPGHQATRPPKGHSSSIYKWSVYTREYMRWDSQTARERTTCALTHDSYVAAIQMSRLADHGDSISHYEFGKHGVGNFDVCMRMRRSFHIVYLLSV